MNEGFDEFFSKLLHTPPFDVQELANGVRLVGHVPHVGPEAYLHVIYPPLTEEKIRRIELEIGRGLPAAIKQFFRSANGIRIFSGAFSIYGMRHSFVRTGIEARQPFSIVTPNTIERPPDAEENDVVIGSCDSAESRLVMKNDAPEVYRYPRFSDEAITHWPSFEEMLLMEFDRLSQLFDEQGRKRNPDAPTRPA